MMSQKKIAFITESVYPYFVGGQEKRVYEYAKTLALHHRVRIVSTQQWDGKSHIVRDHVAYHGLGRRFPIYQKNGKRNVFASMWLGILVFFYVLHSDDDILDIDVFPFFPLLFARCAVFFKRKKPLIIGYWVEYWGKTYWRQYYAHFWWFGTMLERLSYRACDRITSDSVFAKRKLIEAFGAKGKRIVAMAPMCIDTELIDRVPACDIKYDMIYYGRIIAHKHVEYIVEVVRKSIVAQMPLRTLIIGNGPDKDNIIAAIAKYDVAEYVELRDFVDRYEYLIQLIKKARVMIQPSEREGFGITVIEANACGLPVFVINSPDNAATDLIVNDVNGWICADVHDLTKKVMSYFNKIKRSVAYAEEIKMSSIISAQKYAKENMRRSITAYYTQIDQ